MSMLLPDRDQMLVDAELSLVRLVQTCDPGDSFIAAISLRARQDSLSSINLLRRVVRRLRRLPERELTPAARNFLEHMKRQGIRSL